MLSIFRSNKRYPPVIHNLSGNWFNFTHLIAAFIIGQSDSTLAAATLSVEAIADTFLTSDAGNTAGTGASTAGANSDNSGFGAMMISANVADPAQNINYPRTMYAFVAYNMASIKAGFDSQFGAGQWDVTEVSVKFYSNFSIPGVPANNNQFNVPNPGYFTLSWLSNDAWFDPATAGVAGRTRPDFTWNNKDTFLTGITVESVSPTGGFYWAGGDYNGTTACGGGTFSPTSPPCFSSKWSLVKTSNLVIDIKSGGYLSLMGTPADNQIVYLINQLTKPDAHPQISVTADLKEPTTSTTDVGSTSGSGTGTSSGTTDTSSTGSGTGTTGTGNTTGSGTTTGTGTSTGTTGTSGTGSGTGTTGTGSTTDTTDTGTVTDTGSTDAPVVITCTSAKPLEDVIQNQWLIHAGQNLGFYVTAYDCHGRTVTIQVSGQSKSSHLTQSFDSSIGKQKAVFSWTPNLSDVEKNRTLKFKAVIKTKQGVKSSVVQKTKIQVLPPTLTATADPVAYGAASKIVISKALWHKKSNELEVQGQVKWKVGVKREVRAAAIAQLVQVLDGSSQITDTQANLAGNWKVLISLPANTVAPMAMLAKFKTLSSASKKVVIVP